MLAEWIYIQIIIITSTILHLKLYFGPGHSQLYHIFLPWEIQELKISAWNKRNLFNYFSRPQSDFILCYEHEIV